MYQIKRNHIIEELQFEDNGKTLDIKVDLNVDSILKQYINAQVGIGKAKKEADEAANNNDIESSEKAMGEAVLNLFRIVFGDEQTEKIVDFYDNHTLEMLGDIVPFINDVVTPKVQEAQKRIEERYRQVGKRG